MTRPIMLLGFVVVFLGWVLYRLLIKRDLRKNLQGLYLGLFFIAVWVVLYFSVFKY